MTGRALQMVSAAEAALMVSAATAARARDSPAAGPAGQPTGTGLIGFADALPDSFPFAGGVCFAGPASVVWTSNSCGTTLNRTGSEQPRTSCAAS